MRYLPENDNVLPFFKRFFYDSRCEELLFACQYLPVVLNNENIK